ncbi:MAG: retropepsin-like domain-containing protein [Planctomycetes bacterium]|nr:retropepsin-like domain-containing protein [Planctomycetota bacterium]
MVTWSYEGVLLDGIGAQLEVEIVNPETKTSCRIHAQIDTGASHSVITRERLTSLGLNTIGEQKTSKICGHDIEVHQYKINFCIPHSSMAPQCFDNMIVTDEFRPSRDHTIEALLGQNVLAFFQFLYDGKNKKFVLTRS